MEKKTKQKNSISIRRKHLEINLSLLVITIAITNLLCCFI
jgi:hypothetical protein